MSIGRVLEKFATVRRRPSALPPAWIDDAIWIVAAMQRHRDGAKGFETPQRFEPCPFEGLFAPVVGRAEAMLWAGIDSWIADNFEESARDCLRYLLLEQASGLCAPALYERFIQALKSADKAPPSAEADGDRDDSRYDRFLAEMRKAGLRRLFDEKPVLLRLLASLTRQWIETWREFVIRLDAELPAVRREILQCDANCRVSRIEGAFSDAHNRGRSVCVVRFADGGRVVY